MDITTDNIVDLDTHRPVHAGLDQTCDCGWKNTLAAMRESLPLIELEVAIGRAIDCLYVVMAKDFAPKTVIQTINTLNAERKHLQDILYLRGFERCAKP